MISLLTHLLLRETAYERKWINVKAKLSSVHFLLDGQAEAIPAIVWLCSSKALVLVNAVASAVHIATVHAT
ncbi:unnamed protein product [Acanthoscelides obtectus]|uniref:Uncharacterized protein n=1 Tax=Acanthoscelides obtectus TaxID=200917 RepID=A0A9P0JP18_ACAOB|nr:unnamed protein product [Acanthoscelides obtectus]CAK1665608.1 hypothetical protein AOBTE_LOCUS24897 [Acanthoscelides obtectus]